MADPEKLYQDLLSSMRESGRDYDLPQIEKAYQCAKQAHGQQKRLSGEPYIIHPLSVAQKLVELGMDSESIEAALLHDVVEDTDATLDDMKKQFGQSVANLIDGVTKLNKIPYSSREEQQAENVRKMLIAMSEDIRVIIIKLADRMHNMATLQFQPPQKQRDIAKESLEVYAPIAHRLGIRGVKEYLEDISLQYLDPVAYKEISDAMEAKSEDGQAFIARIKQQIHDRLAPSIPDVYIEGRVKSVKGIYNKVFMQGKSIEQIYDVFAVRVIVDNVNDCYNVLGLIHDMYQPLPNRFKDYISMPKANFYQSLHTTVIGKDGIPFEVQIRTWEMHHTAEYGIAAHWKYKLGLSGEDKSLEDRLAWIRQLLENQQENGDATELMASIKNDLGPEEVFVFTPRGDVISLPAGATVIDFAYAIHSAVGNRMIGARVDKRMVSLDYPVKTGEIIEIITTKEAGRGPSRDWLNIVKTSEARNKIRAWFKKERREENITEGRGMLERECKRNNIELTPELMQYIVENMGKRYSCTSEDDFFAAVGYGGIQLWKLLPRIKEEAQRQQRVDEPVAPVVTAPQMTKAVEGVLVDGMDNCLIKFSRCCNPLPGDAIIGFITRGYGVSIHKRGCTNVPQNLKSCPERERWIGARWAGEVRSSFNATFTVAAMDREGLLMDITQQLFSMHIPVHELNSRGQKDGTAVVFTTITVNGVEQLNSIMEKLRGIRGVTSVRRS